MNNTLAGTIHPLAIIPEDYPQLNAQLTNQEWVLFHEHKFALEQAIVAHFGSGELVSITNTDGTVTRFSDGRGNTVGRIVHEFGRDILQEQTPDFRGFQVVATVEYEVVG